MCWIIARKKKNGGDSCGLLSLMFIILDYSKFCQYTFPSPNSNLLCCIFWKRFFFLNLRPHNLLYCCAKTFGYIFYSWFFFFGLCSLHFACSLWCNERFMNERICSEYKTCLNQNRIINMNNIGYSSVWNDILGVLVDHEYLLIFIVMQ